MAIFNFVGQDANNSSNAAALVVNNTGKLNFTVNSGSENFVGNDPNTPGNEAANDTISYTNYNNVVVTNASFIVTFEGYANWKNGGGNSGVDPNASSHIAIIKITSGPDSGKTYTLVLGPPTNEANGMFKNGDHRAGPNGDGVFCFVSGTELATPNGEIAVEDLFIGDLVITHDHGAQMIRWIGSTIVTGQGANRPIQVEAGAFGAGLPHTTLRVSPAHRLFVGSVLSELLFDNAELLAHADDLVNDHSIRRVDDAQFVQYFHVMFDQHELVYANGMLAESFHPDDAADSLATRRSLDELHRLFPNRFAADFKEASARATLSSVEARLLAQVSRGPRV